MYDFNENSHEINGSVVATFLTKRGSAALFVLTRRLFHCTLGKMLYDFQYHQNKYLCS